MTLDESVVKEIQRRYEILMNQPVEELNNHMLSSRMLFRANLALIGYPFTNAPAWMDDEYVLPIMDNETFQSDLYDPIIDGMYSKLLEKLSKEEFND